MNELHFGDNLDVLRAMPAKSVDLIYLDPPFNSNANYNVLYGTKSGGASKAQSHAFEDMWTWGKDAQRALDETADRHLEAGALLDAFQKVFAGSTMMAYLAMMSVRLIEMQRILKPTGALYLHCDPTASHYLKVVLDAIFGAGNFRNEISWKRYGSHNDARRNYARVHDIILYYSKDKEFTFNVQYLGHDAEYVERSYRGFDKDGRRYRVQNLASPSPRPNLTYSYTALNGVTYEPHTNGWKYTKDKMAALDAEGRLVYPRKDDGRLAIKNYLDEMKGPPVPDVWDVGSLSGSHSERIGYPTQKPLALLERIIAASSNPGDIVLDPFCGCGTAIEAAEKLGRRWIGIDVTYLAIHVIEERLVKAFGPKIKGNYTLYGRPEDAEDARALAARDWLEFQKWAVFKLDGLPKDRPGADGGIDGIIRYYQLGKDRASRAIVSVKGGLNVGVDAIHKLKSVMKREEAEIGVLVCVNPPTGPMVREAASEHDTGPTNKRVPKIQIVTIEQLFGPSPVLLPGMVDPPEVLSTPPPSAKRDRKRIEGQTEMLFPIEGAAEMPKRKANRPIRPVDIEVTRSAYTRKAK